jgi:pyruvate/2-oxoglutarate dehydrogenase complex dihydrolipoamide dehydrogenase (E3) component
MPMGLPHRIAIVGAGPIGSALAGLATALAILN